MIAALVSLPFIVGQAEPLPYHIPNAWNYVLVGWGVVIIGSVLTVVLMMRKGRRLSRQLPPRERRWMS
jgi:hypothetical protein